MDNKKPNCFELLGDGSAFTRDFLINKEISSRNEKLISILGGSNISRDSTYYSKAVEFASLISSAGISIITGGGPGIMEAGNKGSRLTNSKASSYGVKVRDIKEEVEASNQYIDKHCEFTFDTLSVRLLTLISNSDSIVLFPGGYGSFEELFSILVRMKVGMMKKIPVYLFGSGFWDGLIKWLNDIVIKEGVINHENLSLFKVKDNIEEMSQEIISYCNNIN